MRTTLPLVLALAASAAAQRGYHVDNVLGFRLKPPPKWTALPPAGDRGALVAFYSADRDYTPVKVSGRPARHTPTLRVMWFTEVVKEKLVEEKDGLPLATPFKGFDDYLMRGLPEGTGILSREPQKLAKVEGERIIAIQRRDGGDLAHDCSIVPIGDAQLVIEFEVAHEHHDKLKKAFDKSLSTFAFVDKKAAAKEMAVAPGTTDREEWLKLAANKRSADRKAWGEKWINYQRKNPDIGFTVTQSKSKKYVVSSIVDTKATKRITEAADRFRQWLDERFDTLSDEAVMPAMIRVLESPTAASAFRSRVFEPRQYDPDTREVYYYKDNNIGTSGTGLRPLLIGLFEHYVSDKDPNIIGNVPRWLDAGIGEFFRSSRVKAKELEFFPDSVEMGRFQWWHQNGGVPAVWTLIQESIVETPKGGAAEDPWGYITECARLIRWFETGGSKHFKKDDLFVAYLRAVGEVAAKETPDPAEAIAMNRLDDDQLREVRKKRYARRDRMLTKINDIAVPLQPDEWRMANEAWIEFNKNFKDT